MIIHDLVNGAFEGAAGFMVLNHCRVLRTEKIVRGVSILSSFFFTLWGFWNLYYYPSLSQPISFYGGIMVVCANSLYIAMLIHYRSQEHHYPFSPTTKKEAS